jgi:hypothetical protein
MGTSYFVFHATSNTFSGPGMPSTASVVAATRQGEVQALLAGASTSTFGGGLSLVGPTPRIVRSATIFPLTAGDHTDVAELIEVDYADGTDPSVVQAAAQTVADAMNQQLQASDSSWSPGTITPWDQATNGSVQWWQCTDQTNCASVTNTRDHTVLSSAPNENPIGPNPIGVGSIGSFFPSGSDVMPWVWIAGGAFAVYLFWPLLMGLRGAQSSVVATARKNPRLTYKQKKKLRGSSFAIPETRSYPITDAAHARNALARVSYYGTRSQQRRVCAAVHRKFPEIHAKSCPFH